MRRVPDIGVGCIGLGTWGGDLINCYYNQWNRPDPAQVVKDVNWELWLGPAPKTPWNERHFWHWRCYWACGTGPAGDLLSHEIV